LRRWRRRNIESYLLHPAAIARASTNKTESDVIALLANPHALNIPTDFTKSECVSALALTDGKEIITKHTRSITAEFGVTYGQIAAAMTVEEIPEDVKTFITQLIEMCKS
jgi:hypothetical protein